MLTKEIAGKRRGNSNLWWNDVCMGDITIAGLRGDDVTNSEG